MEDTQVLMKKIILIFIALIFLQGCMYAVRYDETYRGKIVDAKTGEPIEGVVVLGTWSVLHPGLAGGSHSFYDARETVTDKNGGFEIHGMGLRILSNLEPMDVLVFKTGYTYEKVSMDPEYYYLHDWIKLEDGRLIIPLRKLTIEERKKRRSLPYISHEAPLEKVILMLKEIDKANIEQGLDTRGIWKGEKYE